MQWENRNFPPSFNDHFSESYSETLLQILNGKQTATETSFGSLSFNFARGFYTELKAFNDSFQTAPYIHSRNLHLYI